MTEHATATEVFRAARDFLLAHRADHRAVYDGFRWPELPEFNWAIDWFDAVLAAEQPDTPALWIVEEDGSEQRLTFTDLAQRSRQVAGWLRGQGVYRGDRVLVMLGNQVELWETRDGYGQTETTALVGNPPSQPVKPGSMGRPLPGYEVQLRDPAIGQAASGGEICLDLTSRPVGLMTGYRDDESRTAGAVRDGSYHTGDVGRRDGEGYLTYVGRSDDVFKASDYRISPFELESVLLEHEAVAEAAVVPSPDALRLAVPKAYVVLAAGYRPDRDTAFAILKHCRRQLAPFKRVRRLEFGGLPKTISGKIRRVELRGREQELPGDRGPVRQPGEFWEEDFPELKAE